jgi:hypothetical protein
MQAHALTPDLISNAHRGTGARRTFPQKELYELYQRADSLLKDAQL